MLVRVKAGLVQRPVACDLAAPLLSPLTSNGKRLSGFVKAKRRPIWRGPTMWESPLSIGWRQQALSQTASRQARKAQAAASTTDFLGLAARINLVRQLAKLIIIYLSPSGNYEKSIIAIERRGVGDEIPVRHAFRGLARCCRGCLEHWLAPRCPCFPNNGPNAGDNLRHGPILLCKACENTSTI